MPSTQEAVRNEYPVETVIGLASVGIFAGLLAEDAIVGMLFFALALLVYLLYRILRAVELIATKP